MSNMTQDQTQEQRSFERARKIRTGITYALLTVWALIVLFPFYWMLLTSLKSYGAYNAEYVPQLYTTAPTLLSFAFSPFLSTTGLVGAVKALWVAVGCRVMIGVVAGWLWIALKKLHCNDLIALPIVGFIGSMTNTVFVMGSIYLLFAQQYAAAKDVPMTAVFGLVMGTVTGAGVLEAIAALVLVSVIGKALLRFVVKNNGAAKAPVSGEAAHAAGH